MKHKHNLIWIDLEMTGLDPEKDRIIEIATIITDANLNILAEGPVFAVHQEKALLDGMDEWNTRQHNKSGLVERVLASDSSESDAEKATVDFISQFVDKGKSPMCGNSIHQDRRFITNYMPQLLDCFHYRNLDVSTLKELAKRWYPKLLGGIEKESKHLALDDVKDSINEMIFYREHFIKLPEKS